VLALDALELPVVFELDAEVVPELLGPLDEDEPVVDAAEEPVVGALLQPAHRIAAGTSQARRIGGLSQERPQKL